MNINPPSLYPVPLYRATSRAFGWEVTTGGVQRIDIHLGRIKVAGIVVTDAEYPIWPGQYLEYDPGAECCPYWGWL